MLTGVEVAGLVFGVMGLVPIFKEAYKLVQARRQGSGISDTTRVADEIRNSESTVTNRYQEFHGVYGDAFARGDGIARERLMALIIQLQHGLLIELQRGGQIYSPASLATITITGRSDAFIALSELAQRLATAMPINNRFSSSRTENQLYTRHPYEHDKPSTPKSLAKWLPKLAMRLAGAGVIAARSSPDQDGSIARFVAEKSLQTEEKRRLEMIQTSRRRVPPAMPTKSLNSSEIMETPAWKVSNQYTLSVENSPRPLTKYEKRAGSANLSRDGSNGHCYVCNKQFGDRFALYDHIMAAKVHTKMRRGVKREQVRVVEDQMD